jgi:hypothetical protein
MIINTGQRCDIPAYFSDWFYNRIKEGYVYARNPYYPKKVIKYKLNTEVVDCLCFCTKNPEPMLDRLDLIKDYRQFWFVTITPYYNDIEPYVPHFNKVIESFKKLSLKVGKQRVGWRYDPIFINDKYTYEYHLKAFRYMCHHLSNYTNQCVISFIDLYQKTRKNFPNVQEVDKNTQIKLAKEMVKIANEYDIKIYSCLESKELERYGVISTGCMSQDVLEKAIGVELLLPKSNTRECHCVLSNDIGEYNTCLHGCLYCYANYDRDLVLKQYRKHDPHSPILIGYLNEDDEISEAKQKSLINYQLSFDI